MKQKNEKRVYKMRKKKWILLLIICFSFVWLAAKADFNLTAEQTKRLLGRVLFLDSGETSNLSGTLLRMGNVIFAMEQKTAPEPTKETVPAAAAKTEPALRNQTSYSIDVSDLLRRPLDFLPVQKDSLPQVLIVHTHTSEGYQPLERTGETDQNVVAVGAVIADYLEKQGVHVIHDQTVHDADYNGSYSRCLETVEARLKEYPSIQIVLDVHRDAATLEDGQSLQVTADINGKQTGQIMLVAGTNEGGLTHPNWETNLAFALRVQQAMDQNYPGLARPLNIRKERFNQHMALGMLIVEVAASGNSLEEAKEGAKLFAQSLWSVLK